MTKGVPKQPKLFRGPQDTLSLLRSGEDVLRFALRDAQDAPATLPDATTATYEATGRSCNAPGRCNCCLRHHRTFLGAVSAPAGASCGTLQQRSWALQLLHLASQSAQATLLDVRTASKLSQTIDFMIRGYCCCR